MAPAIPDKVPCDTPHSVENELATLQLALDKDETEHTWEQIDRAVKRFHACVRGGATKHTDTFVKGFRQKELVNKIIRSMATERTRLSASTLDLFASMTRLGPAFAPLLPLYLPALLRLLCRTNKLYITRASSTLLSIILHTRLPDILRFIVQEWKNEAGKSASFRLAAVEAVLAMIGGEGATGEGIAGGKDGLERRVDELEWVVKTAATDREPKVRATAKSMWEVYKQVWPERVYAFTAPMTPVSRRYLNITAAAAPSNPAPKPAPIPFPKKATHEKSSSSSSSTHGPPPSRRALSASTSALHPPRQPSSVLSKSVSHHPSSSTLSHAASSSTLSHAVSSSTLSHAASTSSLAGSTRTTTTSTHSAPPSRSASRAEERPAPPPTHHGAFKPTASSSRTAPDATVAPKRPGRFVPPPPPPPAPASLSASTSSSRPGAGPTVPAAKNPPTAGRTNATGPFRPKPPSATTTTVSGPSRSHALAPAPPTTAIRASKVLVSASAAAATTASNPAPPVKKAAPVAPPKASHAPSKPAPKPTTTKPASAPAPRGRAPTPAQGTTTLAPPPRPATTKVRARSPVVPKVEVSAATKALIERRQQKALREEQQQALERKKAEEVPLPESDNEEEEDEDEDEDEDESGAGDVGFRDSTESRWPDSQEEKSVGRDDSIVVVDETCAIPFPIAREPSPEREEPTVAIVEKPIAVEEPIVVEEPAVVEEPVVAIEETVVAVVVEETVVVEEAAAQVLATPTPPAPSPFAPTPPATAPKPPTPTLALPPTPEPQRTESPPAASPLFPARAGPTPPFLAPTPSAFLSDESASSLVMDFGGPHLLDESIFGEEADESGETEVEVSETVPMPLTPAARRFARRPPSPFLVAEEWEEEPSQTDGTPEDEEDLADEEKEEEQVESRPQTPTPVATVEEEDHDEVTPTRETPCPPSPVPAHDSPSSALQSPPLPASPTFASTTPASPTFDSLPGSPTFSYPPLPPSPVDYYPLSPEPSHTASIIMETPSKLTPSQFTLNFAGRRPVPAVLVLPSPSPSPSPTPMSRFLRDESEHEGTLDETMMEEEEEETTEFDVPLNDASESSFNLDRADEELDFEEEPVQVAKGKEKDGDETREVLRRSLRSREVEVVVSPLVVRKTPRRMKSRDVLAETQA
ncbi:hypothetical protein RQP46_008886 [Phenoliferia psychrophenolica]